MAGSDSDLIPSWILPAPGWVDLSPYYPTPPQPSPEGPGRAPEASPLPNPAGDVAPGGGVVVGPDPGPSTHPNVPDPDVYPPGVAPPAEDRPYVQPPGYDNYTPPPTQIPERREFPLPPSLGRAISGGEDLDWEYHDDGTILVGPEGSDDFVWGFWPRQRDDERVYPGGWELLDRGDYPRWQDTRTSTPPIPPPTEPRNSPPAQRPPAESVQRPGPAGGGWSLETYRRDIERIIRDTAIRKGVGRALERTARRAIGRGILGPLGGIIIPGELGSGEMPKGPGVTVPAPTIPEPLPPQLPAPLPLPEPPQATIPQPQPPEVVVVTAPAPTPTRRRAPAPTAPPIQFPIPRPFERRSRWITPRTYSLPADSWQLFQPPATQPIPQPVPTPSPTPSPSPNPSPTPFPTPLTPSQPSTLSFGPPATRTPTRTRRCECDHKPKKRKKPRKCSTRGNLVWASGPKKGKPAGSRCITFEDFL